MTTEEPSGHGDTLIDNTSLARLRVLDRPGRPSVFAKVVNQYLESAQQTVEQLREALRRSDAALLRATAHRLKSSSAQLGALTVAARCQELESMGQACRVEGAQEVFARLETDYRQVADRLKAELASITGGSR